MSAVVWVAVIASGVLLWLFLRAVTATYRQAAWESEMNQ